MVSHDSTTIAFDRSGGGPPVVIVGAGPTDRRAHQPLAALLAHRCTVFNFDRRGRGDSGDTAPYTVDREYEDLAAVIGEAGGSARVFGDSGGGILALEAAARGLPITKLAVWEPPIAIDGQNGDCRIGATTSAGMPTAWVRNSSTMSPRRPAADSLPSCSR